MRVQPLVHVHFVREGMTQGHGSKEHLNADNKVLIASRYGAFTNRHFGRADLWNCATFFQDGQQHTLPKREKDDRFNHEKFEHRAVGAEQISGGEVEEEESVQGQADGDVVDDGHVQISAGHVKVSITVFSKGLQDDCDHRHQGFHHTELKCGLLTESEEANGIGLSPKAASPIETAGLDRLSSDLRHDGTLTSQVLVTKAQEIVDHKRFITVSDRVEIDIVLIVGEEEQAEPGVKSVNGNDEEDAHDVSLLVWRAVVTQVHVDLVAGKQQRCPHKEARHSLGCGGHEEDGLIRGEQWSLREPRDVGPNWGRCSWRSRNHRGY